MGGSGVFAFGHTRRYRLAACASHVPERYQTWEGRPAIWAGGNPLCALAPRSLGSLNRGVQRLSCFKLAWRGSLFRVARMAPCQHARASREEWTSNWTALYAEGTKSADQALSS